ncbi:Uncharacterized protein Adt_37634 [Abeliophyllum distichum]|uniref:Ankyrin repeat protein n=1 Tax=Abeliophyllum distichum TaxID=126358 RepID=A0ABD1PZZ5_9LAMI
MLAAENSETAVFDYLMDMKLLEFVFYRLDDQGNSILHLAAMLGELLPRNISGAAVEIQCEIMCYKYAKASTTICSITSIFMRSVLAGSMMIGFKSHGTGRLVWEGDKVEHFDEIRRFDLSLQSCLLPVQLHNFLLD